jgi:Ca2+-transporting ATPase
LDQEIINKFCKSGLRSIVYAYKDIDVFDWEFMRKNNNNFEKSKDREILERDFCFVAAFGLNDDLREGVPEAVKKLTDGGINIRMISGDNLQTAI